MRKQDRNIYNFLVVNGILNTPLLNDQFISPWGHNLINVYQHYDSFSLNVQAPNSPGPIEKHPYIELYHADCDLQRECFCWVPFLPSSLF